MASNNFKDLFQKIRKASKDIQKEYARTIKKDLKKGILASMNKGKSPVAGETWSTYSSSYNKQIGDGRHTDNSKSSSPVNLKLSGDLHRSLIITSNISGDSADVEIKFVHPLADIHNKQGAGKAKVIRRMLPTEPGEKFNREIDKLIIDVFESIVDKNTKDL